MKKLLLLPVAFLMCITVCFAQTTVSGTITDENNDGVYGATILEQGTTNGTLSDLNGTFSLDVTEGSMVEIKYIGYRTQTISASDLKGKTVSLELDAIGIDQVVVSASKRAERVLDAPASVTVIKQEEITRTAGALTAIDHVKKTPGVDVMETGLVSSNVNIRGFNNIFSGAMLTMVDNRIGRVPSLKVNAYQLIPVSNHDIEKMEIVRGPGSALYGPNAADGVLHIITKNTLDQEHKHETIVSLAAGSRSVIKPEFRHSTKVNDNIGFKISGGYMQGHDWPYFDPREPAEGDTVVFGTRTNGNPFVQDTTQAPEAFQRNFFIRKYNADARFDFRINNDMDLTLFGGFANTQNLELTGLGAGQSDNWVYAYAQAKFRWKKLFVQYFLNSSNSGDTYLIPQSGNGIVGLIDRSKLHAITVQHSSTAIDNKLNLIYGLDLLMTRPDTRGTINGRFEDSDNFTQIGGYVQGEYDATDKISVTAAARVDYMDAISEVQVSPRLALVYKPTTRNTIRATWNRAYSSPSSLNLSLDLSNGQHPLHGFDIRGIGNTNGYNYSRGDNGLPTFGSFWDGNNYEFQDRSANFVGLEGYKNVLKQQFLSINPNPALVNLLINSLFDGIDGSSGLIQNVDHTAVDFVSLLETGDLAGSAIDITNIQDAAGVESTITQTFELGYKGIIEDKLFLTVDGYYTQIQNYVSPLTNVTPFIVFDPTSLQTEVFTRFKQNSDAIEGFSSDYAALDQATIELGGQQIVGNNNGTALDEAWTIFNLTNANLGIGNAAPVDPEDPNLVNDDIILTYVNLGNVDIAGIDLGFTYQFTDDISLRGAASWVSKTEIPLEGAAGGFVSLNAPKYKTSLGFSHFIPKYGVGYTANWRWQDAYRGNSAVYVGEVVAANFIDIGLTVEPKFMKNTSLNVQINNLLDYRHQRFPGTPRMGRMAFVKLTHMFHSKK